jgi:hypothetical protein
MASERCGIEVSTEDHVCQKEYSLLKKLFSAVCF